jgi:hypothetical protein
MTRRLPALAAAIIAAALLGATALTSPAHAQTRAASPRTAATTYLWWQIENNYTGQCIQESGDTSAVYMGTCSINHSDYWRSTAAGMLLNEHSGKCLTASPDGTGVYADTCTNNHVQLWNLSYTAACNPDCAILTNGHFGYNLSLNSDLHTLTLGTSTEYWNLQ